MHVGGALLAKTPLCLPLAGSFGQFWRISTRRAAEGLGGLPVAVSLNSGKLPTSLTVAEIFNVASLSPRGPVRWGTPISEAGAGVYVVALVGEANAQLDCPVYADYLEEPERLRWLPKQPVIYIGQTTRGTLAKRVSQFYSHRYGQKAPHRGGQALKLLRCDLWVYWSPTSDPRGSELTMISAFKEEVGQKPFANRL